MGEEESRRRRTEEILLGAYVELNPFTTTDRDIKEAKEMLAEQAAEAVKQEMLERDMFVENFRCVAWKIRLYASEQEGKQERDELIRNGGESWRSELKSGHAGTA